MFTKLSPSVIRVASRRLRRPMTAALSVSPSFADGLSAAQSARQIADRIAHAAITARRCRLPVPSQTCTQRRDLCERSV